MAFWRNIAREGHSHVITMDGTLLDRFSGSQSVESRGWDEQQVQ